MVSANKMNPKRSKPPRRGVRRTAQSQRKAREREQHERDVDVEHRSPAIFVGQPTTERWPENRPDHHTHAEHRECATQQLRRIDRLQSRLTERQQSRPAKPLHETREYQRFDVRR
jgi:hypothetical protein